MRYAKPRIESRKDQRTVVFGEEISDKLEAILTLDPKTNKPFAGVSECFALGVERMYDKMQRIKQS